MLTAPLGGDARSRLLPMSVPFRFFGAAVVFQLFAWTLLLLHADALAAFRGGPGPLLAALHLVTLGVLAMTAAGASMQLLPIATRQPLRSVAAVKLLWWLLAPGTLLFALGALRYDVQWMEWGAALAALALLLHGLLLADNLWRARGMRLAIAYGWAALGALVLTLASGLALAAGYVHGFALERAALAAAHLLLATCGYMGLLALGLSHFLLPMFGLAPAPQARASRIALIAWLAALLLALASLFGASSAGLALAAALGCAAALTHVIAMERALARRLRPRLAPAFVLVRAAWAMLVASLLAGLAWALGWSDGATVFVLLLVPGWLLSFLLAVLQRIVPFLASVHAAGAGRGAPLPSLLASEGTLLVHRLLHLAALAALLAGVLAEAPPLLRAGAALGLAGALAFAGFFVLVLVRLQRARRRPAAAAAPALGN